MRDDFWRMRALLSATFPITPMGLNWDVRRLDGKRYYAADLAANRLQARPVQLWETAGGELVGYVLAEGRDDAHLQIHPDYRHLEPEMVAWAEAHLGARRQKRAGARWKSTPTSTTRSSSVSWLILATRRWTTAA
jgi:hypothetical protein